ncbi:MAG: hypothetical protein J6J41_07655 [Clostridia bacterium]|nr:hypothetical protein [Clostridia bacterium]
MANRDETEIRQARAEMEQAKAASERSFGEQKLPRRFRLYDKIKENVSLRTVDTVIAVTALLIIALLIYGIATGTPPQ